jgi:large subunit ribosomal protein L10
LAISKERKEELVKTYNELIGKSTGMILIEYRGLTMKGMDPLRSKLRDAKGELHVVKNTLAQRALTAAGHHVPDELLTHSTAIGFAFSDVAGVAKALSTYAKESEFVSIKGGLLGDRILTSADVEALAELPPLPIVRAQLLGLLTTPASRLAGVVASGVRQIVNVVKAYSEKAGEASTTVAAPTAAEAPTTATSTMEAKASTTAAAPTAAEAPAAAPTEAEAPAAPIMEAEAPVAALTEAEAPTTAAPTEPEAPTTAE